MDHRQLNNMFRKDSYQLPRINDILDALAGSTLHLKSGYWQVEMDPADREKSAFTTGSSSLQTVMPFGVCNVPSTFERLMESMLRGLS